MNKINILKNPVQGYEWGSRTAIQALLGKPESLNPMAELWMGAHPKAPSEVMIDGEWKSLIEVIERNPESILGKPVAEKFSNKLPFLFKVLAAEMPLSIQVHPNLEQAMEGFSRENSLGIPLNSPDRNYRDENHKPEVLLALTPFQVLKGFRKIQEILGLMGKATSSTLAGELGFLRQSPDANGIKRFFTALMAMDESRKKKVLSKAVNLAERHAAEDAAFHWMVRLNREYPGDIGILSPLILNVLKLDPGEAIYLPAGELHGYLHGVGIELMANSDNVLRGGLTPKYIDVPELLRILNFKIEPVRKIRPVTGRGCESRYPTSAEEFLLSVISLDSGKSFTSPQDRSVEILICAEGEADIQDVGSRELLHLTRGKSIIVPAAVPGYRVEGIATLYKASIPI